MASALLEVKDLVSTFTTETGTTVAVDRISFSIDKGETVGIVGESGCGKSTIAMSILRLLPGPVGKIAHGEVLFNGQNLTTMSPTGLNQIRGKEIGMIFQEPMKALNPVLSIGKQLTEVLLLHENISTKEALRRAITLLARVGIPAPDIRVKEFPHQLSGGMRQRVMIAMALACKPSLIIADEPTTALDVTIQAQILNLLDDIQQEYGTAILLITHDLGVIAEICQRILVMYAGQLIESGPIEQILQQPAHPYTQGLLASIPSLTHEPKTKLSTIAGRIPALIDMPAGCRFQNRCDKVMPRCKSEVPLLKQSNQDSHKENLCQVRCFAV